MSRRRAETLRPHYASAVVGSMVERTSETLFAERCADGLQVRSLGRLGKLEETVLEAANHYGLRASFLA